MEQLSLRDIFLKNFHDSPDKIKISFQERSGLVLHGLVHKVSPTHFEVLVQEKEVLIHCMKDENGIISCMLNSHGNPDWVNGICNELKKALHEI